MAVDLNPNKLRWSELDEEDNGEDGEDLNFLLPPRQVIGPDEKGIKKVIEYKFNEDGDRVKVTTTTRVSKVVTRVSKRAVERRSWAKFGEAVDEDVGSRLTMVSTEDIRIERPKTLGGNAEETINAGDSLAQPGKEGGLLMICRACGKKGKHWTAACPFKDLAPETETSNNRPSSVDASAASSRTNKNSYVPPSMRAGAERSSGSDMRRRNEDNSVKVTNLSDDAQEADLRDLFSRFGPLTRVYIAKNHKTGLSRGLAFVNFVSKEDAQRAIDKLNGYGYDNLILTVEWSEPRSK